MNIVLQYENSALAAPQSFRDGMQMAANILDAAIYNNITVTILVGYGDINNGDVTDLTDVDEGESLDGIDVSYSTLRAALASHESSSVDVTFVNSLPNTSSVNGVSDFYVPSAIAESLGLMSSFSGLDGAVGMGTDTSASDIVGSALHELTHAMGREPGVGPFDLFRYTSPGTRLFSDADTAPPAYFSIDGGYTKLADFGQASDPSDFLNTGIQGDSDPFDEFGSNTTVQNLTPLDIELLDAMGFDVTGVVATLSVQNDPNAIHGQQIALSSLVTIGDPNNYGFQKLELWQGVGGPARDYFSVNGVAQGAGYEIDLAPGDIANTAFVIGANNGTDKLWAQVLQNNGTLTGWQQFTIGRMPPALNVFNFTATSRHQTISLPTNLEYVFDPNALGYQKLELWDSGDVADDRFVVNGMAQSAGHEIDLSPTDLSRTTFNVGALGGTDRLWARLLQNDGTLTSWQLFTVTSPLDHPPVVTAPNYTATHGQNVAATSLFSVTDADNDPIAAYQFWAADTSSGHWVVGGTAEPVGQAIDVTPAQFASATYQTGSGSDHVWVRANDGITWGAWTGFFINAPIDAGPTVSVANLPASHGQSFAGSALFSNYSDPFASSATQYDFWNTGTGGGHFALNGAALAANHGNIITAAQLAQLTYQSGSGADTLWVKANDGTVWGPWSNGFTVTAPIDNGPTVSVANLTASAGQTFAGAALFSNYTDPFNSAATQYDFWDTGAGGGHFVLNGTALAAGNNVITAAQLTQLSYQSGSGADTLDIRANDGTVWGSWSSEFTVTAPIDLGPTLTVGNLTATPGQGIAASSLFSYSDPFGSATQYDFYDTGTGGGHFALSGTAQGTNQNNIITAAQLSQLTYVAGTGADTLWVRANDGISWGPWSNSFTVTG